jgi:hypothetical protein
MDTPNSNVTPTHPSLILYALTVYGYCLAATQTSSDIQSPDPTANGLFTHEQAVYNNMQAYDSDSNGTTEASADLDRLKNDPETAETIAAIEKEDETPQDEDESSDIDEQESDGMEPQ